MSSRRTGKKNAATKTCAARAVQKKQSPAKPAARSKKFVQPAFCDLGCEFADWPRGGALDGSGSCRTFQALHCKKLNRVVHKNGPCQA